jgi:hypothetical protein
MAEIVGDDINGEINKEIYIKAQAEYYSIMTNLDFNIKEIINHIEELKKKILYAKVALIDNNERYQHHIDNEDKIVMFIYHNIIAKQATETGASVPVEDVVVEAVAAPVVVAVASPVVVAVAEAVASPAPEVSPAPVAKASPVAEASPVASPVAEASPVVLASPTLATIPSPTQGAKASPSSQRMRYDDWQVVQPKPKKENPKKEASDEEQPKKEQSKQKKPSCNPHNIKCLDAIDKADYCDFCKRICRFGIDRCLNSDCTRNHYDMSEFYKAKKEKERSKSFFITILFEANIFYNLVSFDVLCEMNVK